MVGGVEGGGGHERVSSALGSGAWAPFHGLWRMGSACSLQVTHPPPGRCGPCAYRHEEAVHTLSVRVLKCTCTR
jgi:hypothetical protein